MFDVIRAACAAVLLVVMSAAGVAGQREQPGSCDRSCLLQASNLFVEGLLHASIARLPLGPGVRATENGNDVAVGGGSLWGRAARLQYRQTWVDPATQSAMFFGTVADAPKLPGDPTPATWWWYEVRLTMPGGRITEIEEIVWQAPASGFGSNANQFWEGDPRFEAIVPHDERMSREELLRVANIYWDALGSGDTRRGLSVPFSPDCQRLELGFYTTNNSANTSCVSTFEDVSWRWGVSNRRFYVVDPARGVVAGIGMFNGQGGRPSFAVPEAFKIENGVIRKLVANFNITGVQTKSGWPDRR